MERGNSYLGEGANSYAKGQWLPRRRGKQLGEEVR